MRIGSYLEARRPAASLVLSIVLAAMLFAVTAPAASMDGVMALAVTPSAVFARKAKAEVTNCWRGVISGSLAAVHHPR